jgi:multidrug efflux pump subunit AcrA (membrane-fusion protein)
MLADTNATASIQKAEQRIQQIKAEVAALGEMRPGSLSRQYNVCGKPNCRCKDPQHPQRHGPYYQLSWVHRGKSSTQFIRPPLLPPVQAQLATYNRFRKLTEEWINLALRLAQARLLAARRSLSK